MSEEKEVASPSQYRRVWEIHQMLIPKPDDLISTHRFFVREGPMTLYSERERKKKPRYLFLFNDIMLVCKKASKGKWRVKLHVTLRSSHVNTEEINTAGFEGAFGSSGKIVKRTKSFAFYASSNEESETVDKEYMQKQKDLATAPEQGSTPPADLRKKSKDPRSQTGSTSKRAASSRDGLPKKSSESPSSARKAASSRDGLPKNTPANTNPRSKSSRQHRMTISTPSVVGNPSQWDPLASNASNRTSVNALLSPRHTQTSPGGSYQIDTQTRSAGGAPSSPFDSFITQSQPGYTQPYATNANPFSPRTIGADGTSARPVSMMMPSPNPFTTNTTNFRHSVAFGSDPNLGNPFATNTFASPRATINFGSPVSPYGSSGNLFTTMPAVNPFATVGAQNRATVNFGESVPMEGTTSMQISLVDQLTQF